MNCSGIQVHEFMFHFLNSITFMEVCADFYHCLHIAIACLCSFSRIRGSDVPGSVCMLSQMLCSL